MQDSPLDIGAVSLFSYGWRRKRILKKTVEGVAGKLDSHACQFAAQRPCENTGGHAVALVEEVACCRREIVTSPTG
jgi:hypothetical protein